MKPIYFFFLLGMGNLIAQSALAPLTVDKIMRDPKWIGSSPSNIQWSEDSKSIYFQWNPDLGRADSTYQYNIGDKTFNIKKLSVKQNARLVTQDDLVYNYDRTAYVYNLNGDIYYQSIYMSNPVAVSQTLETESNPVFIFDQTAIGYHRGDNLYAWMIEDGSTIQLTNFIKTSMPKMVSAESIQETWLKYDQLREFDILRERKSKKDLFDSMAAIRKRFLLTRAIKPIYTEDKILSGIQASPSGKYISYRLVSASRAKQTIVPNYVTESGFTENIPARTKVGAWEGSQSLYIINRESDSVIEVKTNTLEGIRSVPLYYQDYPATYAKMLKDSAVKQVAFSNLIYNPSGDQAMVDIRSNDNKDRWICLLDLTSGVLRNIDHQHDEAWIGGPGIGSRFGGGNQGWINNHSYYFQSEKTGYSHLYVYDLITMQTKAITQGTYEVQKVSLSNDKSKFYITTNQVHPGEQHFYHIPVEGGEGVKITSMTGANNVSLSPDEKYLAILHSYSNKPWELYIQENKVNSSPLQITDKGRSSEFKSYAWRDPELITFKARDGANVFARLYKPMKKASNKAAVIFVHGAGYLQNAHKWWSSYFREYMFHNLLVDQGYTVIDIDYRGSAGYGRDWRTGIYRFMGGKDLSDHIDAAKYLVANHGVMSTKIGIYGGSYGGFITLMGLFTSPETFAAGAALRPVTDWAQYNHPYTSNILNEPARDSIAYKKSSPIYHAAGLNKPLLICHGMVDVNVHYQDAVKLTQRLIELKKENWELASYPMEDHGFVEPGSWTDEYKRILKLFNTWLN